MVVSLVVVCVLPLLVLFYSLTSGGGDGPAFSRLSRTIRRFPFVVATSAIGTAAAVILIDHRYNSAILKKVFAVALLTLPLLFSSRTLAEKRGQSDYRPDLFTIFVAIGGILYFFLFGDINAYAPSYRHGLWTAAAWLLVLIIPFFRRPEEEDSWHFNASLAFAFAIAFIWALVLFAGLSAAFAGVEYLLGVKVTADAYFRLWVIMTGLVGVFIFLSAVPPDLREIPRGATQSRLLEGFIRFLLVPLVVLYLVILYMYAGKIILQGSWPKGGVAGFILGFSGVGIVTYYLTYGYAAISKFQATFRKLFFLFILPLTVMLFLSVWRRVSEYGITESRYFGIVSALWLAVISLYYIFSRKKDLRIIPASICVVLLTASFGPWGALSLSGKSQTARLKGMLERAGLLANGNFVPGAKQKQGGVAEINRTIYYLHKIGYIKPLTEWSGGRIKTADGPEKIADKIGIPYIFVDDRRVYFNFDVKNEEGTEVSGFRYFWDFDFYPSGVGVETWRISGERRLLKVKPEEALRKITVMGPEGVAESGVVDMVAFANELLKESPGGNSNVSPEKMVIDLPRGNERVRFVIRHLSGSVIGDKTEIYQVKGVILWSGK